MNENTTLHLFKSCPSYLSAFETVQYELNRNKIKLIEDDPNATAVGRLVMLSLQWDETSVFDFLQEGCAIGARNIVIIFGARLPNKVIWQLIHAGAEDVIFWQHQQFSLETLLKRLDRWAIIDKLFQSDKVKKTLIGNSPAWKRLLRQVIEVAYFTKSSILILGESGTGKELISRLIHELDIRPYKQELVLLDCSSISPELSGSEFFGHEKGAFTNAISTREGAFALADKGTLFLDEIGELPLHLQAELLRVVQEGTYKRVGSNTWKQTNFRLVCATNRNLLNEVQKTNFREDLYYRISTWVCQLPPLRDRREDIPELARFFLKEVLKKEKIPNFDENVLHYLQTRAYPGNIRELRQLVTRIAYRHVGEGAISIGDIPEMDRPSMQEISLPLNNSDFSNYLRKALGTGLGLKEIVNNISDTLKEMAIEEADGNLQAAAQRLEVTDRTLQNFQATRRTRSSGQVSDDATMPSR
ncbi:MAG: hypothetical protein RLZZ292_306 [Bacteroidota bacterium]|jgi:transcriptional regulator with GAF, ATPase, and Fis domain